MSKIVEGIIVKCLETGRTGIVLEIRRGAVAMCARVHWDTGATTLTECCELEAVMPSQ